MRFPDEIVFHESIKESDGEAVIRMLRRVSVDIDINRITMSGMTAIHQVRGCISNDWILILILSETKRSYNLLSLAGWSGRAFNDILQFQNS